MTEHYSHGDMLSMQQEAIRRVRQMQEKQRASLQKASANGKDDKHNAADKSNKPEQKNAPEQSGGKKGSSFLKLFNFKNFNFDSDSTLILLIALLLADNEDDELLLPILVYLLM